MSSILHLCDDFMTTTRSKKGMFLHQLTAGHVFRPRIHCRLGGETKRSTTHEGRSIQFEVIQWEGI